MTIVRNTTAPGSLERLIAELRSDAPTPVLVRGELGSGRSSLIRSAADIAGCDLVEYEASVLAMPPATVPITYAPTRDEAMASGLTTLLDDAKTFAVLHDGDPAVVVVDHLDLAKDGELSVVIEAMEWMAARVRVIGVVDVVGLPTPRGWRSVDHTIADVQAFWTGRPALRVIHGDLGS